MRPACGATMPQMRLRNVDLPLPEGPISRIRLPVGRLKRPTVREKALRPGQVKSTPDMETTSGGWAATATIAQIMPARLRLGLARVTSNLVCPLGVMTFTSSFCAPAKAWK